MNAALGGADELEQLVHFGAGRHLRANSLDGLGGIQPRARQQAEGVVQRFDGWRREPAALQADAVRAEDLDLALADGDGIRQHVLRHHAIAADEGVAADAAELVHADVRR